MIIVIAVVLIIFSMLTSLVLIILFPPASCPPPRRPSLPPLLPDQQHHCIIIISSSSSSSSWPPGSSSSSSSVGALAVGRRSHACAGLLKCGFGEIASSPLYAFWSCLDVLGRPRPSHAHDGQGVRGEAALISDSECVSSGSLVVESGPRASAK